MYHNIIHTVSFQRGWVPGVDNKKLKEIILKNPKPKIEDTKNPEYIVTGYEDTLFPMNLEFKKVLDHINSQFSYVHREKLKLIQFWAQIHEKNMSTVTHHHAEKEDYEGTLCISGVYYVQVPKKSGHLVLLYPHNTHVTKVHPITPSTGEFFLFPSAMEHYVTRNFSNDLRISVSFNFKKEVIN